MEHEPTVIRLKLWVSDLKELGTTCYAAQVVGQTRGIVTINEQSVVLPQFHWKLVKTKTHWATTGVSERHVRLNVSRINDVGNWSTKLYVPTAFEVIPFGRAPRSLGTRRFQDQFLDSADSFNVTMAGQ